MSDRQDSSYDFAEPQKPSSRLGPASPARPMPGKPPAAAAVAETACECPFCGFVHRGKARARCPECAAPMDASMADQLSFSDPAWVRRAGWGGVLLGLGVAGHAAGILARVVQVLWLSDSAKHFKGVAHAGAAVAVMLGVLALFWPEPRRPANVAARALAWSTAGAAGLVWMVLAYWALRAALTDSDTLRLGVTVALLCHLPLCLVMATRVRAIAQRIPDDGLTWQATYSGWLTGGVCILSLALMWGGLLEGYGLAFFPISFPLIAIVTLIQLWAAITALRVGLNMLAASRAGAEIALRKAQRAAAGRANQVPAA